MKIIFDFYVHSKRWTPLDGELHFFLSCNHECNVTTHLGGGHITLESKQHQEATTIIGIDARQFVNMTRFVQKVHFIGSIINKISRLVRKPIGSATRWLAEIKKGREFSVEFRDPVTQKVVPLDASIYIEEYHHESQYPACGQLRRGSDAVTCQI